MAEKKLTRFSNYCSSNELLHAMRYHWFEAPGRLSADGWQEHDHVLLALVQSGSGSLIVADQRRHWGIGSLAAIGPYQPYRIEPHQVEGLAELRIVMRRRWVDSVAQRFPNINMPWANDPIASHQDLPAVEAQWFIDWVEELMQDRVADRCRGLSPGFYSALQSAPLR